MARDREVEWQLDAVDLRPVERWLAARPTGAISLEPAGTTLLRDRYLDTEDWRLHRGGATLRIRTTGRRSEATLKSKGTLVEGLRDRRELTEPLASAEPERVRALSGEVGRTVRALSGTRRLRQLFEIRTRRRTFTVRVGGAPVGELALDDTTIPVAGGRPARLQRVEIEVEPDAMDAVAPLVAELQSGGGAARPPPPPPRPGGGGAGAPPPPPPDLGPVAVDDEITVGELAFSVLRAQFAILLEREHGARLGDDPEQVHDMRVAIRRMRAAMSLFREALPVRSERLRQELEWIAGALGEVRDLDVQLEQFREWERDMPPEDVDALRPLVERLEERHGQARAALLQQLDSRRYDRLVAGMTDLLRAGPLRRSPASRQPAAVAAPDLLRRRRRAVRRRGDDLEADSPPEDFHALRIRCKRFRYAIEFCSPLAPKPSLRLVRRLVAVQDNLGEHQDAQVAMSHIAGMLDDDLPTRAVFLLGRISERYSRAAADLREAFPDAYDGIRGRPWRRLRMALEDGRERALATMPPEPPPRLRSAPPAAAAPPPPAAAATGDDAARGLSVVRD